MIPSKEIRLKNKLCWQCRRLLTIHSCAANIVLASIVLLLSNASTAQVNPEGYVDHHVHLHDSSAVELGLRMRKAFGDSSTAIDSLVTECRYHYRSAKPGQF